MSRFFLLLIDCSWQLPTVRLQYLCSMSHLARLLPHPDGLRQERLRLWRPRPHVEEDEEQSPHASQLVHWPRKAHFSFLLYIYKLWLMKTCFQSSPQSMPPSSLLHCSLTSEGCSHLRWASDNRSQTRCLRWKGGSILAWSRIALHEFKLKLTFPTALHQAGPLLCRTKWGCRHILPRCHCTGSS